MKTVFNVVVQVLITFIISLTLNFILHNYFIAKNGEIQYGPLTGINGKLFYSIQVENYTDKDIDGLRLSIPTYLNKSQIISSAPIVIEDINTNGQTNKKVISVSNIAPLRATQFLIPIEKANDEQDIEFLNRIEKGLYSKGVSLKIHPLLARFNEVLINSILYTFIFAVVYAIYSWHNHNVYVNAKKLYDEAQMKIKDIESNLSDAKKSCHRCRVLLLARLRDYAKENDFWKDSIRKLLYENKTEKTPEQIFEVVTHSLKTYATLCKDKDFDVIHCMASMINSNKIKADEASI